MMDGCVGICQRKRDCSVVDVREGVCKLFLGLEHKLI